MQPPQPPAASTPPLPAPRRRPGGGAGGAPPARGDVRRPGGPVRPGTPPRRPPGRRPVPSAAPLPQAAHDWFADRLLDVLTGRQPLTILAGKIRNEAYQQLWELRSRREDWRPRAGARGRSPFVYRCSAVRTTTGSLEAWAVVCLSRDVFRALAFRLERGGPRATSGYGPERWHCTAVEAR